MKKTPLLVPLLLCLALFGDPRTGAAVSLGPVPADLLDRLEKDGWQMAEAGVMQRTLDSDKVETLGFGDGGLRFKIQEMKAHLAFLRKEYSRYPSPELRQAIRAHRAEILRAQAALKKASSTGGGLESANQELVAAGTACPVNYDASVFTFPLASGAGANAKAFFNNGCGYSGEVYTHSYTRITTEDGEVYTGTKNDPAPNTIRSGGNVSASASMNLDFPGATDCYSYSYASMTSYDLAISYSQSAQNYKCSGNGEVRPFAPDAASNLPLPISPELDPDNSAMVANLNSAKHQVNLYGNGKAVFNASAGTPRVIVCTEPWGMCDLSRQPVPVNASWKPSSGGHPALSVIDYANRKIYDFYRVATNPNGTVKVNSDGTVSTGWGRIADLDGNGQASGSSLSDLFGLVRVFEMERAASDPANAIQHALALKSRYACSTWRYPAPQSNGSFSGAGCIPVGSRVFLDSSADCSTVSSVGEKAVCHALRKYGAYVIGTAGSAFNIVFEAPSTGQPGGSGPNPYPGVGFPWDYYDMVNIPWSKLKVAKDCQCAPY